MSLKLKAALVTLVVGTCAACLVILLAYQFWLIPYLCFALGGGVFLWTIYLAVVQHLTEAETKRANDAEKARRLRA